MDENVYVLLQNPETKRILVDALSEEILDRLSERIEEEVRKYADEIRVSRRDLLKVFGAGGLLFLLSGKAGASTIADDYIKIGDEKIVLSPAQDGQLIVRDGGVWKPADPSIDKWGGTQLTPRDITLDLKRLTENTFGDLKAFKVISPFHLPIKRRFFLYSVIPSDSGSPVTLSAQSGSGSNSSTVHYIQENEICWITSAGLVTEYSSTPDITWNTGKYLRFKHKITHLNGSQSTGELVVGGSTDIDNWRRIHAASEQSIYIERFAKNSKAYSKYDFATRFASHYWFLNKQGDEYFKITADDGIFTYTSDVPTIYMTGLVFDASDILAEPTS